MYRWFALLLFCQVWNKHLRIQNILVSGLISTEDGVDCRLCPAGYSCDKSTGVLRACQNGQYSPEGHTQCLPCSFGFICKDGFQKKCGPGEEPDPNQTECTKCPKGYYSTLCSAQCEPCPAGSYCPLSKMSQPLLCPMGQYTDEAGQSSCKICNSSVARTELQLSQRNRMPISCPPGTHRDGEGPICDICPSGGVAIQCPAGTYGPKEGLQREKDCTICPAGVKDCLKCPAGYYCPEGTSDPLPCQPGTFNPLEGQDTLTDCRSCYPGKACTQVALKAPDVECMPGFVCPPGSARPNDPTNACPPGTMSNRTDLTDRSQCQLCPARYACLRGTGGVQRPPLSCFAGHYCPVGTMFPTQHKCPAGTWSDRSGLKSESECRPCPRGWYCLAGVGVPSGRCSSGYYCPEGTMYGTQFPCPRGTYSIKMGNGGKEDCVVCLEGHYCQEGSSKPLPCPPTTFRQFKGGQRLEDCAVCPAGYFCPHSATVHPRVCGTGSYSDEGSEECLPCLPGHYCSDETTSEEAMLRVNVCPPGFLCSKGLDRDPQRSSVLCPIGFYCPGGGVNPNPIPCPNGTYSRKPGLRDPSDCTVCPVGMAFFVLREALLQSHVRRALIALGQVYVKRQSAQFATGADTARELARQNLPVTVMEGSTVNVDLLVLYYCLGLGSTSPTGPCAAGYYCSGGSASPVQHQVEEGHYSVDGAVKPEPCSLGTFQPVNIRSGDVCPAGYYCPEGTRHPHQYPCPAGTWSNMVGAQNLSCCSPCPAGLFCNRTGLTHPTGVCAAGAAECSDCPPGWLCLEGEEAQLCPEGHYCLGGTVEDVLPCPPGTYNPKAGQRQVEQCSLCSAGTRHATQFPCPRGYYNPETMTQSLDSCLPCPPGHYCEKERLTAVSGKCKAGWFCVSAAWNPQPFDLDNYTSSNCLCPASSTGGRCQAGFFCPAGSYEPIPCPSGAVCNATAEGFGKPELCPLGTFSAVTGLKHQSRCQPCTAGHYCSTRGLISPTAPCSQGYWCPPGQTKDLALPCPLGHQCPLGSSAPVLCPSGTYQDKQQQANCTVCEEGFYCDESFGANNVSALQSCPKGYYCPKGTRYATQFPCPAGTYNPKEGMNSLISCLLCPAGHYCPFVGLAEPAGLCKSGYWCKIGSHSASPSAGALGSLCPLGHYCPKGTLSNSTGQRSEDECQPCPEGFYCASIGLSVPTGLCSEGFYCSKKATTPMPSDGTSGNFCPQGHYCPTGSTRPVRCDLGTFMTSTQATKCWPCTAGWYCVNRGRFLCPQGFYCPEGTAYNWKACPAGTYSPESGLSEVSQCRECDGGHYCSYHNATSVSGHCSAGYYCTRGNIIPQPPTMSLGYFCKAPGRSGPFGPCAAGHFCLSGAVSSTPEDGVTGDRCPPGHYCPLGTSFPLPCPPGHYSNSSKNTELSACLPCPAGFSCSSRGLTAPSHVCHAGYYCPEGQNSSQPAQYMCSPGQMCPPGSATPIYCAPGSYQSLYTQEECLLCSPGFFCEASGTTTPVPCPLGHYCPAGTKSGYEFPCPVGTYSNELGISGVGKCISCPSGLYCGSLGLSTPTGNCSPGYLCIQGASQPQPPEDFTGRKCPAGFYCPTGTSHMHYCPPGTFGPLNENRVHGSNAEDNILDLDHITGNICPQGHYCPIGSVQPLKCPPGTFLGRYGARSESDCSPCVPGFFCPDWGQSTVDFLCPEGWFCPKGSAMGHGPGFYCLEGAFSPTPCPAGTAISVYLVPQNLDQSLRPMETSAQQGITALNRAVLLYPVLLDIFYKIKEHLPIPFAPHALQEGFCSPGHYCTGGADTAAPKAKAFQLACFCDLLPESIYPEFHLCAQRYNSTCTAYSAGFYCPVGSTLPQLCNAGLYCNQTGLSAPVGFCPAGFYCPKGSSDPYATPCPPGHYCPRGTAVPLPCLPGTLRNSSGAARLEDCLFCPSGHFCGQNGLTEPSGLCAEGYYCPVGQNSSQPPEYKCKTGHYCEKGSMNGKACPIGSYQPRQGQQRCEMCPAGFFCPQEGNISPTGLCMAGFLCSGGASVPSPVDNVTGMQCPPGFYCLTGSVTATPCPKGTFSVQSGLKELGQCQSCYPGFYCSKSGLTTVSGPCLPGFYCTEGSPSPAPVSAVFGDVCPPGYYCQSGSAVPTPCPVGTYLSESGGKGAEDCTPCPNGLFQDQKGQRECKSCPPGFHCPTSTQKSNVSSTPLICPEGYYCPNETLLGRPVPCPKGTYSDMQGLTSADECMACPLGFFCGAQGLVQPSGRCAHGFLCFVHSTVPNPTDNNTGALCPAGAYCQLGVRSGDCSPGYYCDWGSSSPEQRLCPAGFYCLAGTDKPIPCGPGTFSSVMGNSERDKCEPCPAGYFCQGLFEPSGQCQEGYYCSSGSISPNTTGYKMNSTGNNLCPPGHYCPAGTGYPLPCPPGTFSSSPGLSMVEKCLSCPPGYFCDQPAMANVSDALLCDAGYICVGGSRSARPVDGLEGYICPNGYSCPIGTSVEKPCEPGTYSNAPGAAHCIPCPSGTMCPFSATQEPTSCPKGHYCPSGTALALPCPIGTLSQITKAQSQSACVPCPPGFYCSIPGASQPQGQCQAGYFCQSGSAFPAPVNTTSTLRNGPCPKGHFCPLGTLTPLPCPAGTNRNLTDLQGAYFQGHYCPLGSSVTLPCPTGEYQPNPGSEACIPCRPGYYCEEAIAGDPSLCPSHSYCPAGTKVPQPCPNGTYTPPDVKGLQNKKEWFYCPEGTEKPQACPGNTIKETPGGNSIRDPQLYLCPEGHYCDGIIDNESEGKPGPRKCPQFTYRPTSGAGSKGDCLQCPAGTFCNATGLTDFSHLPCPPGYWCSGTGLPVLCPPGTFRTQPGANASSQCSVCAAGTYCPDPRLTGHPNIVGIPCRASYACPIANTLTKLSCDGGFMPRNVSGLRISEESSCKMCEAGTYRPTGSSYLRCLACPSGYHCPPGTDDYNDHPCPVGYVCPWGSANPVACPPGSYSNSTKAKLTEECHPCPPDTFNHLFAQRACASSCMCIGKNRAFQHSDGSCVCKAGYVFYNELDFKSSTADSTLDCQPEVSERCGTGQVRLASSQECVSPFNYSCNITCGRHGGKLDASLGICNCEMYVSVEELCNSSCLSALPVLSARLAPDGQLVLRIKAMDESTIWSRNIMNVLGPDSHINSFGKIHFVQFSSNGVFGWLLKDPTFINIFLSEPFEILDEHPRKRRDTDELGLLISEPLPRIPNPIACLSPNDMLIFQLTINHSHRLLSHFPVYQKNHLFSSNPIWDFGAFRQLERLVKHSKFNSSRFAHVFMEPGKYVFLDNAVPDWSLIVVVKEDSTECDPTTATFQPTTPAQLVRHGIVKQQRLNLLPDWGTIGAVLALMLLLIVVLTLSALLLRPNHANLIAKGRPKPKWRSLGEPAVPVAYVYDGECMDSTLLGLRGVGEGAEEEEPAVCKGFKNRFMELEGFNVKTLYDKLEDQNLHLASQLAKHRKDTQEFYRNICQQTDMLREVLENMEPSVLSQWKKIIESNAQARKESFSVKSSMGLMEALLKSLEAVLFRLDREAWQQQQPRESRESQIHINTQVNYSTISSTDMSELKARSDTEADSFSPGVRKCLSGLPLSTAACVSEEDLARLVALTPLTRTLQDIQQSLQELSHKSRPQENITFPTAIYDDPVEEPPTQLIPVALDNLPPRSFAVFLFGCHVVKLLNRVCSFPSVMLLLAETLPVTRTDSPLAYCNKDFYYDTSNQILYILESKLQNAGQFISVLVHSLAYIKSGFTLQHFFDALHSAISALSMQLFHRSFTQRQQECMIKEPNPNVAFSTMVEDFLSVKIPTETQFSQTLLAEREQSVCFDSKTIAHAQLRYRRLMNTLSGVNTKPGASVLQRGGGRGGGGARQCDMWECQAVCVDAVSDTETVQGKTMKLTCILCMKREEINAQTKVYWYYKPDIDAVPQEIYLYDGVGQEQEGPWKGRLLWNGSKDLQDVSISIVNVTVNDSGLYECVVHRQFSFNSYTPSFKKTIKIQLVVREEATEDLTALYSEIMMYILLVFLTLWLLVEMIYCYRKISKSDEQAQDSVTDYLAIPSENKENPPGPAVTE
ncbi:Sodium channel subunit beta-3 [Bagarius yarrelli]|uniref:Sodium channel regulatory subunit beta-3 n=1 Tax=Bagarius yarrelli TaxID=175774 RepID=A0A556V057_BAGYA|nr:Sodium channel subunit beta-3 [Bagarius yarrelli]